jgi:spore coat polysaccharide biosynthesis protein SpsF
MTDSRVPGFITVRTASSRLPKKCLLPFGKKTVLHHIIERCRVFGIEPIVCTSTDVTDNVIEEIAQAEQVKIFRGSLNNKIKRWVDCANAFNLDVFHSVDADDPFFDADEIRRSMETLAIENLDMVAPTASSSAGGASVGYSLTKNILCKALEDIQENQDTEMMWYFLEKIPGIRTKVLPESKESVVTRLTLDYAEDYWLLESVRRIVGNFAPRKEIDELFRRNPDLYLINWFRNQEWKQGQLDKKI